MNDSDELTWKMPDDLESKSGLIKIQNRYSALCVSHLQPNDRNSETKKVKNSGKNEPKTKGKKLVVNLSSKTLSDDEINILNKGLKFCPTQTRADPGTVRLELDNFHNKLRTKQFFERENPFKVNSNKTNQTAIPKTVYGCTPFNNTKLLLKLKPPSKWRAPTGSPSLETYINMNELSLNKIQTVKITKQNITQGERKSLKNLARDKTIVIKPADKGGAVVVMNTVDYITEAQRQLNDHKTYKKLEKDPTSQYSKQVNDLIQTMIDNQEITEKVGDILKIKKPKTPQIYFLPKIHKKVNPPPGRPIVSANSCPTENISAFVDLFLNPLVPDSPHHVKDTTDFLNKIGQINKVKHGAIIGTMDVTSLYTNIPNN